MAFQGKEQKKLKKVVQKAGCWNLEAQRSIGRSPFPKRSVY
jgi:hypothetical protein